MDDNVGSCECCVGRVGMVGGCVCRVDWCTGVWWVCAQACPQHHGVADVTDVREVFSENIVRWRVMSALGTLTDAGSEFFDVIEDLTALGHL